MAAEKVTLAQILEAIAGSRGVKATIAERLGVHRHSVDNYLDRYATAKQAFLDEQGWKRR